MKKKLDPKAIWTNVLAAVILLTLAFIWGQSLKSIPESKLESEAVLEQIKPIIEPVVGEGNVTDHLVRKLAHFIEFCVLGIELMTLAAVRGRTKLQCIVNCAYFGLTAAVVDETIQIFSSRGSQVQDVLLDLAGYCCGLLLAGLAILAARAIRRRS